MPDQLAPFVLAGKFRCDKTMMVASGLPSHLMLSQRIEVVEAQLALFQKVVHELHVEVMEILPMAVAKEVLAHVTVNGAVAVTSADLVALRADITKSISTSLESFLQQMGSKGVTQSASDPSLSMSAGLHVTDKVLHVWGDGSMHRTPESFVFPQCGAGALWDSWWFGNASLNVGPFRFITPHDLKVTTDRMQLSRAKTVMKKLEEICLSNALIPAEVGGKLSKCSRVQSADVFSKAFAIFASDISLNGPRPSETNYGTLYNKLNASKKRTAGAGAAPSAPTSPTTTTPTAHTAPRAPTAPAAPAAGATVT